MHVWSVLLMKTPPLELLGTEYNVAVVPSLGLLLPEPLDAGGLSEQGPGAGTPPPPCGAPVAQG